MDESRGRPAIRLKAPGSRHLTVATQAGPRLFQLIRHQDISGVSGTGVVAEGVEWSDGSVALHWGGRYATTTVWPDGVEALLAVHGHEGATTIRWLGR